MLHTLRRMTLIEPSTAIAPRQAASSSACTRAGRSDPAVVSVIVPTYHRPEMLGITVRSVLEQQLTRQRLEVIVALSDPRSRADRAEANRLAELDDRVRIVEAAAPGPGAARNAGIRASSGAMLAFIDDDCQAQPGWLQAGVDTLRLGADIAQGATGPLAQVHAWYHSIWVERVSWLWESCNLFVSREVVDRAGMFDESWNPTGRAGQHYGEDTEWGWRLVRHGARWAFAPHARIGHAVQPRTFGGYLKYKAKLRHMPLLVRELPEVRQRFYRGYFLHKRHVVMAASVGLAVVAAGAAAAGQGRAARAAGLAAAAGWFSPARGALIPLVRQIAAHSIDEAVELGSLATGSIRHRRLLL